MNKLSPKRPKRKNPNENINHESRENGINASIESNIELIGRERLTQAIQLEEEDNNKELNQAVLITLGATALITVGLVLAPARKVIKADGQIKPYGSVNVIQHNEGGIVQKVHVKNGDVVEKGDLIVTLSPKDAAVEIAAVSARLDGLILKQKQLNALIEGERLSIDASEETSSNKKIIRSQERVLESKRKNLKSTIDELTFSVKERKSRVTGLEKRLEFEKEEARTWETLVENGAASRIKLNDILKNISITNSELKEANAQLEQEKIRLAELKERLNLEAKTELAEAVSEEAVVNENIKKLSLRLERTRIKATETGTITDLQYQSEGSVIMPGSKVATIVPSGRENIAEIKILSKDIGFIEKNQTAEVKILPYDPSIYGTIGGKILNISGSSTQDELDGLFYYQTTVKLDQQEIIKGEKKYRLQPGMPVETDILGDKTNLLAYIVRPIIRTLR